MDPNWLVATVERNIEGYRQFFWQAFAALRINGISGDYVEFGSWGANTFAKAYEHLKGSGVARHMWAFDSFEALPEAADPRDVHPGWQSGFGEGQGGVEKFHEACAEHGIPRDAYTAVEGYYDATLPPLGTDGPPSDIALVLFDCNMYSSAVTAFEFLAPRLKHGMIVAFDDYFCWSPTEVSGERSAMAEFLRDHPQWNFLRYKEIHWGGTSFVVEHAGLADPV